MMSDWLSVAQFGAKGDGVTDDTAAIPAGLTVLATTNNKTLFTIYTLWCAVSVLSPPAMLCKKDTTWCASSCTRQHSQL